MWSIKKLIFPWNKKKVSLSLEWAYYNSAIFWQDLGGTKLICILKSIEPALFVCLFFFCLFYFICFIMCLFSCSALVTDVNECLTDPCLNGGICNDNIGGYNCTCPRQYVGETCEIGKSKWNKKFSVHILSLISHPLMPQGGTMAPHLKKTTLSLYFCDEYYTIYLYIKMDHIKKNSEKKWNVAHK